MATLWSFGAQILELSLLNLRRRFQTIITLPTRHKISSVHELLHIGIHMLIFFLPSRFPFSSRASFSLIFISLYLFLPLSLNMA
jgi:hypothetical protein